MAEFHCSTAKNNNEELVVGGSGCGGNDNHDSSDFVHASSLSPNFLEEATASNLVLNKLHSTKTAGALQ